MELLVVIAIISVLAGLLLPALEDALTAARRATEISNHRQLGIGLLEFAGDHDDLLPAMIRAWRTEGNRDMKDLHNDAQAEHIDGTTRMGWGRGSNIAIWEGNDTTCGFGTAIALGYYQSPGIFFSPGWKRPGEGNHLGGLAATHWDQPEHTSAALVHGTVERRVRERVPLRGARVRLDLSGSRVGVELLCRRHWTTIAWDAVPGRGGRISAPCRGATTDHPLRCSAPTGRGFLQFFPQGCAALALGYACVGLSGRRAEGAALSAPQPRL